MSNEADLEARLAKALGPKHEQLDPFEKQWIKSFLRSRNPSALFRKGEKYKQILLHTGPCYQLICRMYPNGVARREYHSYIKGPPIKSDSLVFSTARGT